MTKDVITQTEGYLEQALKQYNITDAAIAQMESDYMKLKIAGIDDKKNYQLVRSARMQVKEKRVEVEKTRKSLKEESLKFGRAVDAEAKRIRLLLEPIENYLIEQEKVIDEEKQRIKDEADRKERERIQGRLQKLYGMGCVFDGFGYVYKSKQEDVKIEISTEQIQAMSDEEYSELMGNVEKMKKQDAVAQAELDRQKKEEEERLAKIRAEQEAESKRLAAEREKIRAEQEKKEAELKAAQDKLAAEKKAMEAAKETAAKTKAEKERIEKAKQEAAEKALKEKAEAEKKEAEEKAEKERIAKMEAELAEKLKPDNEKLFSLANVIYNLKMPELTNKQSYDILNAAFGHLQRARQILRQGAE